MKKDYLQFYQHITAPFYRHPWTIPLLRAVNKFVVWVMYVAYIVILVWVEKNDVLKAGPFLLIPGIGFILLSFIPINPLIRRQKIGDSLPSRHVFSATVIAMCGFRLNLILGIILLALAVVSAITRVIGGVHFPRDVIIGFICGVICGSLLFLS